MSTTTLTSQFTGRDRAVLRAVAAGRCALTGGHLTVDGVGCCDQFVGGRLAGAGLIAVAGAQVTLTPTGEHVLTAA